MYPLRTRIIGIALAAILGALPALGQPTMLSLDALLAEVDAANPSLRAARLEAAARAEVGDQVGALPDPTVSLTAFPYPLVTALGAQRSQWRVEQMIPWPGTLGLRERSADLGAEVAEHEAEVLALDLALQVKRAYYTLYRLQRTDPLVRTKRSGSGRASSPSTPAARPHFRRSPDSRTAPAFCSPTRSRSTRRRCRVLMRLSPKPRSASGPKSRRSPPPPNAPRRRSTSLARRSTPTSASA